MGEPFSYEQKYFQFNNYSDNKYVLIMKMLIIRDIYRGASILLTKRNQTKGCVKKISKMNENKHLC